MTEPPVDWALELALVEREFGRKAVAALRAEGWVLLHPDDPDSVSRLMAAMAAVGVPPWCYPMKKSQKYAKRMTRQILAGVQTP